MAKLNFFDFYTQKNMEFVKQSTSWEIWKDPQYYYKFLQEQNYSALNGKIVRNLEFMMDAKNQIEELNPVSDIYYIDDTMLAYRTPIVTGKSLKEFFPIWNYNLDH